MTLAWGVLAFGAVYPWAYWSLAVVAIFAGAAGLWAVRGASDRSRVPIGVLVALGVIVGAAAMVQLLPVRTDLLERITPNTVSTLRAYNLAFPSNETGWFPLSIRPQATVESIALGGAAFVLMLGVCRLCSLIGVRWLAKSVTVLGVFVAMSGIIQKPLYTGNIYGFWQPEGNGLVFGPFVNRNYFAGWMMMALPVTLGLLCAGIDRGMHGVKPVWRERLMWFGSAAASRLTVAGTAAGVMALSLVLTFSRSGMGAFGLAVVITGFFVLRRVDSAARRAVGALYLVGLFSLILGWVGVDRIGSAFGHVNWREYNDRRGAWADARRIASLFPLTGTGLGTYGVATLFYQQHDLEQHYEQAHNDYLELAAEGGALVVIPVAMLLLAITVRILTRFRDSGGSATSWWVRAGAVTGLLAIGLQEVVDFSLQIPGNAMLCAALLGVAMHKAPHQSGRIDREVRRPNT